MVANPTWTAAMCASASSIGVTSITPARATSTGLRKIIEWVTFTTR
jgi:hypothetical protein